MTGHAVLALDAVSRDEVLALGADGFSGAHDPRLITAIAGSSGWVDSLDVLLGRRGMSTPGPLIDRPDLAEHPRARHARDVRVNVRVLGLPDPQRRAVVMVSQGIGGLPEISFELETAQRGARQGAALVRAALAACGPARAVLAACAPRNTASLRSLLSAGFVPLGSVQLFRR